jgi:uncharacterized protein (TIGR02118 family)
MVKVYALLPRRQDVTVEFFHEHWATVHGEVSKRITTIRRYVQAHRVTGETPSLPAAELEGIAEMWFDDATTAAGMGEDPNYVDYAYVDALKFIDMETVAFVITTEHQLRPGPATGDGDGEVKAMLLLRRAPSLSPAQFADRVAALADGVPSAQTILAGLAVPEMYADGAEPAYDGVIELTFRRQQDLDSAHPELAHLIETGLAGAIDPQMSAAFTAHELPVISNEKVSAAI